MDTSPKPKYTRDRVGKNIQLVTFEMPVRDYQKLKEFVERHKEFFPSMSQFIRASIGTSLHTWKNKGIIRESEEEKNFNA